MHEIALAQNIIEIASHAVEPYPIKRVLAIHVRVGPLSGIDPGSLLFAFDTIVDETPLAGATLQIETTSLLADCTQCQGQFEVLDMQFACPFCGSPNIKVLSGDEMDVVDVEVEEKDGTYQA